MTTTTLGGVARHEVRIASVAVFISGVPVESYEPSRGPVGHFYPGGVRVGDGPMRTHEETEERQRDGAAPDWWPAVYITDDDLVELPGGARLTREQFRAWLEACTAALAS